MTTKRPLFLSSELCSQTDPEAFYPDKGEPTEPAKAVCRACPVRFECLEWALDGNERFGVWGGLSPTQRRRIKITREKANAAAI